MSPVASLQLERLEEEGSFWHAVTTTDKTFGFANGYSNRCEFQVALEFVHGLLSGGSISLHILDPPGNSTAPLPSIADLANMGVVLDLGNSTISIRGRPPQKVPKSKTGFTIIPVTKSAVER